MQWLANLFKLDDKPWWDSLTNVGVALWGAGTALEASGQIPMGTMEQTRTGIESIGAGLNEIGAGLAVLGFRRIFGRMKNGSGE